MKRTGPRVALVVGNGLALDLRDNAPPELKAWNPAAPFDWQLRIAESDKELLDLFPDLKTA